jgi:translation elongation factor EF-4
MKAYRKDLIAKWNGGHISRNAGSAEQPKSGKKRIS